MTRPRSATVPQDFQTVWMRVRGLGNSLRLSTARTGTLCCFAFKR